MEAIKCVPNLQVFMTIYTAYLYSTFTKLSAAYPHVFLTHTTFALILGYIYIKYPRHDSPSVNTIIMKLITVCLL